MKVLHITTGLENGGAEAILYRLISRGGGGNTHEVVSLMDAGFYGERILQGGIKVHSLQMPRGRLTLTGLIKLYRLIRSINPDVIQTWMYHADLVGGVIARLSGKRVVVWGIHNSNLAPAKTRSSTRFVARLCAWVSHFIPTKIICCSEQAAQAHITLGYRADKMVVVHNGTDVNQFKPNSEARARLRAAWCIAENEVLLGMVARWDLQKDHANLFAAAAYLKSQGRLQWRCVLVGPEMLDTNHEVVALLNEYGVRNYFLLGGLSNDIPTVMNGFDLHLLPSSGEAFGNVTIEAMSCGVPAVVTSVGAGETIVGETGWVVPPSDSAALCGAILKAIDAMAVLDKWAERKTACRLRIVEYFSLERMVNSYCETWEAARVRSR